MLKLQFSMENVDGRQATLTINDAKPDMTPQDVQTITDRIVDAGAMAIAGKAVTAFNKAQYVKTEVTKLF